MSRIEGITSPGRAPIPLICLTLLMLCLSAAPSGATTVRLLDDDRLIDASPLILTGTCDAVRSEWIGGTLFTVAAVDVEHVLKGGRAERVEVLIPGGIDTDREVPVAVTFPGAPTVRVGERVLLFLNPVPSDAGLTTKSAAGAAFTITGFSQGKFTVVESAAGEPTVHRDLAGLSLLNGTAVRAGGDRAESLGVLQEKIARRVGAPARIDLDGADRGGKGGR